MKLKLKTTESNQISVLHHQLLVARGLTGSLAKLFNKIRYNISRTIVARHVFDFDQGHLGSFDLDLRGGKGLGLSDLVRLGMPVPDGATVMTTVWRYYLRKDKLPKGLALEVVSALESLESKCDLRFGDQERPLLISVRSGAPVSIPGMMDSILNVGLNRQSLPALAARSGERLAWDCYRRCLTSFGTIVFGVDRDLFENRLEMAKKLEDVRGDDQLSVGRLMELCQEFEAIIASNSGRSFPSCPYEQLALGLVAVLDSWQSERAIAFRKEEEISPLLGTAINIQAMVFGNRDEHSGTGVLFSANPITGEDGLYGEFLGKAQGEDVVGGTRNPLNIASLSQSMPAVYARLADYARVLSKYYRDMVEIEYTVESGVLYLLQVRKAKRAQEAAITFAVNQVEKGEWIEEDGMLSTLFLHDEHANTSIFNITKFNQDDQAEAMSAGFLKGTPASPGVATGRLCFSIEAAIKTAENGEDVILARVDTSPDDLPAMLKSKAIITARGGSTCHAAVVAIGRHIPAIVGCQFTRRGDLLLAPNKYYLDHPEVVDFSFAEGEIVSVDGRTGVVMRGAIPIEATEVTLNAQKVRQWFKQTQLRLSSADLIPELAAQIWDINQWHNDFYLLNSMAVTSSHHELNSLINEKLKDVEYQLAQIFTCYLTVAIYTELIHLPANARVKALPGGLLDTMGEFDDSLDALSKMKRLAGKDWSYKDQFFDLASRAFLDNNGSSCFCGKPWSQIAAAPGAYLAGKLPATVYIDHVFDLKHNGGRLFDKSRMVKVNEPLLRSQLDVKKTVSGTSKLLAGLTTIYQLVDPDVLALYDSGAAAGLWSERKGLQAVSGKDHHKIGDSEPEQVVG